MKKTILFLAALAAALTLSAQEIRTNYRSEGMTHISTEAESCKDFTTRVERVGFERIRLNGKDVTAEFYAKNWW